jgi:hypothetical protein
MVTMRVSSIFEAWVAWPNIPSADLIERGASNLMRARGAVFERDAGQNNPNRGWH